ncbi:MAG: hypothetical protein R6V85_08615 [Polyangia bacterium]
MQRQLNISIALVSAAALLLLAGTARAQRRSGAVSRGGDYSVSLESVGGGSLPTYHHRGETWVQGSRGQRYAIRVRNHTQRRVEAVVTVDGRDVVTGRSGNYRKNRGYVIQPRGSVRIDGFRTSWSGVAAFRFTDVEDSYAARMGGSRNVGVIGVAIFEERRPNYRPPPPIVRRKRGVGTGYGVGGARSAESAAPRYLDDETRQGVGTGYGEDRYSPASETSFQRRSKRPNARLKLYYDDRRGLIDRGVIPRPWNPRPRDPDPFPDNRDPGFAPPPPSRPYYWE